jgi:hypothetical protein
MTEKDYRKLVTELEQSKEDKEEINNFVTSLFNDLNNRNNNAYKILNINKALRTAFGTSYHNDQMLDLLLEIDECANNSFPLMNKYVLQDLWNYLMIKYQVEKVSQIKINEEQNSIYLKTNDKTLNLLVRYHQPLLFQTDFYLEQEAIKLSFINNANKEFNLFKNTIQLINYYCDQNAINLPTYNICLLLYYGLSENFTGHTYYAYLKEFIHALDDFLKGIKIDQDDQTYQTLNIKRGNPYKKPYMLIDISNPNNNLTSQISENTLQDMQHQWQKLQLQSQN